MSDARPTTRGPLRGRTASRRDRFAEGPASSEGSASPWFEVINPPELGVPRGFAHGLLAPSQGRVLFVAGQTAAGSDSPTSTRTFTEQFEIALARVLAVVRAAGGESEHVARMTMYVTSMEEYRKSRRALGGVWRRLMGSHYPAMAVVQVTALVDEGAIVEIDATAVLP